MLSSIKENVKNLIYVLIILACAESLCMASEDIETKVINKEAKSLINVNATVDKAKITIGDKINYKIMVDSSREIEVVLPVIGDKIGDFTVVDSGTDELKKDKERITKERWYILETYNIGSYIIPANNIKYKKKDELEAREVKTPEIFVEVVSVLDENASDIRDIRPPVVLQKNYSRLYIVIAIVFGVLGIVGTIIMYFYNRRHKKIDFVPLPLSAHEIAYNELDSLRALNLISIVQIKEYYYRLSNIVRHYIENRFRLMAPERTTEEFLTEMAITDKLEVKHKELISNFLEHCDLVKFAGYGPDSQEIENAYNSAKKLVDETREVKENEVSIRKKKIANILQVKA
ncbi:MAG: hypothetical protein ACE5KZ_12790 [Candidatus Scalinduaceae bacterium]